MFANTSTQAKQIVSGWKNVVFQNDDIEKLARKRRNICNRCRYKTKRTCGACGCPLVAKLRVKDATCPIKRW